MARRRVTFRTGLAFAALTGAAQLAAQSTTTNTTATPTPPPSGTAVGPPQLRDFTLNGTVTQPAQPTTTAPSPAPRSAPPTATSPVDVPPTGSAATAPAARSRAIPSRTAPAPPPPVVAGPDRNPSASAVTVDLPPATVAPSMPAPSLAPPLDPAPAPDRSLGTGSGPLNYWPWAAALLAAMLGAGFLWWRRRQQAEEEALQAADNADLGAMVAARDAAPALVPRAAPPAAPRTPAPSPATTPSRPQAARPVAATTPAPPAPTPARVPDALVGGIVASGLKPRIELELLPLGVATDAAGAVALMCDIVVVNRGSAPARDELVEAQLLNAGPKTHAEVERFFLRAPASGERLPPIAPMSRASVRIRLAVAAADLAPLIVEGRHLLVPIVAVNALYRSGGAEVVESSSFLVGRGDAEADKLAPFRLDLGARNWTGLAARLHSTGLQR
jgi:hypothetical protein